MAAIAARQVTRWYVSGKGFNSLMAACRWEARRQLKERVRVRQGEIYQESLGCDWDDDQKWRASWRKAYAELFPPCDELGCCCDSHGYDYEPERVRDFCARARQAYIDEEATKMAKAFVEGK